MRVLAFALLLALPGLAAAQPAASLPNLVVTGIMWSPAQPTPGDVVVFTATVANVGDAPAGSTITSIDVVGGGGRWGMPTQAIAPGESVRVASGDWMAPASGSFEVAVKGDAVDQVVEADEADNTFSGQVEVAPVPLVDVQPSGTARGEVAIGRAAVGRVAVGVDDASGVLVGAALGPARGGAVALGVLGDAATIGHQCAMACAAASGTGNATADCFPFCAAISAKGDAHSTFAASGAGDATGQYAASAAGDTDGSVAVSGTGHARGSTLALSGCDLAGLCT